MRPKLFFVLFACCLLVSSLALAQTDSTAVPAKDSVSYSWQHIPDSWKWIRKHFGADLFLTGDAYVLHLSGGQSITGDFGLGAEIRLRPIFLGATAGLSGDEGIPGMHAQDIGIHNNTFTYLSEYVGVLIHEYRLEVGRTSGDAFDPNPHGDPVTFRTYFIGISEKFGRYTFIEPGFTMSLPVASTFSERLVNTAYGETSYLTERFHPWDLFFSFSVKLGIGFN